jgi:hypothetical protein
MSTLKELEDKYAILRAARNPQTGAVLHDTNEKYRHECQLLALEIGKRRDTEAPAASGPQINPDQLKWLNRAQGATDEHDRRLYVPGTPYFKNLNAVREHAMAGNDISKNIAATERVFAEKKAKFGPQFSEPTANQRQLAHEAGMSLGTPSHVHTPPQVTPTTIGNAA